jgi:ATP-binding protein involved in chromosome partitioning
MMTDDVRAQLIEHVRQFMLSETGQTLAQAGARIELANEDQGYRLDVALGFPLERSRAAVLNSLREQCEAAAPGSIGTIHLNWQIETHAVQAGLKPLPGVSNIIAIASGKGGVGKSTVAVNMAVALAREGARVGLLDADIYGPSQPRMLGLTGQRPESRDGQNLEPLLAFGIKAMSIGFLVDERQPMAWRGPMVTSALNQLLTQTHWGELDYLLVDMPPGTGDIQLTLSQRVPVSGAVIVTTPQDIALADARKGLEMFQKVKVPVLGVVENMSVHVCSACGHEERIFGEHGGGRLAEQYGVALLGALPLNVRVREESDRGQPIVVADPDSAPARAFCAAALRMAAALATSSKDYSRLFPKITVEEDA